MTRYIAHGWRWAAQVLCLEAQRILHHGASLEYADSLLVEAMLLRGEALEIDRRSLS